MAWTSTGPVSTPPKSVVSMVAAGLLVVGLAGGALGFQSALRGGSHTALGSSQSTQDAQAIEAKPIVDLPPPVAAPPAQPTAANAVAAKEDDSDDDDDSNAIAAKVAQVQQAQSKPAQKSQSVDDILASPTEKPQAPAKPSADEEAPSGPAKSDVPF